VATWAEEPAGGPAPRGAAGRATGGDLREAAAGTRGGAVEVLATFAQAMSSKQGGGHGGAEAIRGVDRGDSRGGRALVRCARGKEREAGRVACRYWGGHCRVSGCRAYSSLGLHLLGGVAPASCAPRTGQRAKPRYCPPRSITSSGKNAAKRALHRRESQRALGAWTPTTVTGLVLRGGDLAEGFCNQEAAPVALRCQSPWV